MNIQQAELYQRIQQFSLDAIDVNLPFSQRLARENGWTVDYAKRAIAEYKKFAFLAIAAGHSVTPSDQVDQVWHLHLLYTQSYWQDWCPNILQTSLHHNPTKGGQQERGKFNDWYSGTLASYERFFQQPPPADIWSPPQIRFGRELKFVRINPQQHWILPKPDLSQFSFHLPDLLGGLSGLLIIGIVLWGSPAWAAFTPAPPNLLDMPLDTFMSIYGFIVGISFLSISLLRMLFWRFNRRFQLGVPLFSAVLFGLFLLGSLRLVAGFTTLPGSEFLGFFMLSAIAGMFADLMLHGWTQRRSQAQQRTLQTDDRPSSENLQRASFSFERFAPQCVLICITGLYFLAISRIGLGLYRQKPIGYLALLCVGMAIYLLWRQFRSTLKLPLITPLLWISILVLTLLILITAPQLLWILFLGVVLLLSRLPHTSTGSGSSGGSSSGTTCANGDCGDSGGSGDSGGGDGGCGGCGGD